MLQGYCILKRLNYLLTNLKNSQGNKKYYYSEHNQLLEAV